MKKSHERVLSRRKGGRDHGTGWGDLVCMFGALADPRPAAEYIDAHPRCKIEPGNSRAFLRHWCHTLTDVGLLDAKVTADHPLAVVFTRGGRRTYAAYNFEARPLVVRFSEGTKLIAKPRALTVR